MTNGLKPKTETWTLRGQRELPPSVVFQDTESDLWPYRRRTVALLRRYGQASVEVGRVPSLLGREFFRSRVSSYTLRNFEDVIIFVTDMERAIEKLGALQKKLLAMNVLEEYYIPDMARLLGCNERTVRRALHNALDELSQILLDAGVMEELEGWKSCQEARSWKFDVSYSKEGENKVGKNVRSPQSDLVS